MSFIDRLEQKGLFRLTRFLALSMIVTLLIGIVIAGAVVAITSPKHSETKIAPEEIMAMIRVESAKTVDGSSEGAADKPLLRQNNSLAGLKVPDTLTKLIDENPDNLRIISGWVDNIEASHKQEFIDEMTAVIDVAQKQGLSPADGINTYKDEKMKRISDYTAKVTQAKEERTYIAIGVLSAVFLVALFSLVLVMLAIERNTRTYNVQPQ